MVLQHYLSLGYRLLKRRWQHSLGEVDLLLQKSEKTWLMVEVKTLSQERLISIRFSHQQKLRLKRIVESLTHQSGKTVDFHLAFVTRAKKVLVIEDVFVC